MTTPTDLFWKQQQGERQQQDQNLSSQNPIQLQLPEQDQNYNQSLQTIDSIGKTTTAGVLGSVATRRQQIQEQEQLDFQRQQQQAMERLQKQQKAYYEEMNQNYVDQHNSQQADILKQFSQSQVNTQVTNFKDGNATQIAQLARNAGFPESAIPTVVSIALAESGGRSGAVNNANNNGSSDYGLMQINSVHSNLLKNNDWEDPQQNMNMAFQIYKSAGNKFTPWVTYNTGAVNRYAGIARQAAQAAQKVSIQPFMGSAVGSGAGALRQVITKNAQQYVGVPYVWGGNSLTNGVDCSGLVQQVYSQYGIKLPRTADQQAHMGVKTSISKLQPGDLVAWQGGYRGPNYVGHIAIYLGGGRILEAQQQGVPVHVRALTKKDNVFGVHLTNLDKKK